LCAVLARNVLVGVLVRAVRLDLWLVAGHRRRVVRLASGGDQDDALRATLSRNEVLIRDHDLFYFDDSDLGWDAENEAVQAGERVFGDLPVGVEIRAHRSRHRLVSTMTIGGASTRRMARTAGPRNVTDFAAWPVRPE
jgi:hypothetical protein